MAIGVDVEGCSANAETLSGFFDRKGGRDTLREVSSRDGLSECCKGWIEQGRVKVGCLGVESEEGPSGRPGQRHCGNSGDENKGEQQL